MLEFLGENLDEIASQTVEHLWLSGVSISLSGLAGILLGVILSRNPRLASPVIGATGILQTIPSIALLGLFIPLLGIGKLPAIAALFLYALLPIVRNTYTGLITVDPHVREAAVAMGMTSRQLLRKVEFPLALPVIFAGIRTATVINVGVATLCALIGAGGLGEFIFRGITLNQTSMILAGAVPASILAVSLDLCLGFVEKNVKRRAWPFLAAVLLILVVPAVPWTGAQKSAGNVSLTAGFNSEFMNREDGWPGLRKAYGLDLPAVELEITLMYEALRQGEVDVIAGFTTDGRIGTYDLAVLTDDLGYFPPYHAVPMLREQALTQFPMAAKSLQMLEGSIPEQLMASLNLLVDTHVLTIEEAADSLLSYSRGRVHWQADERHNESLTVVVGSKAFTENYILASFFAKYLEATTPYATELKLGFGGTKLLFDALRTGAVDLYPEYTGTAWLLFVKPSSEAINSLKNNPEAVFENTKVVLGDNFGVTMMPSLGFNNTTALMMRRATAEKLKISSISELKNYLQGL